MNALFPASLRARVVLLLLVLFGLLTGQTVSEQIQDFEKIREDRFAEFRWTAKWIQSEQNRHIAQSRQVAFIATNYIRKGTIGHYCNSQGLSGAPGLDPEYGHFAIADLDGNISCNSIPWLTAKNVADQDYFKAALKQVDIGVIDEADNRDPHQYAAIKARAMRDSRDQVEKVILVAMDFSWVKEEIDAAHLPASGHLLLVDSKGTLVAGSENMAQWVDRSVAGSKFYQSIPADRAVSFEGEGFSGEKSLVVSEPIDSASGFYRVIIDVPEMSLTEPIYRKIGFILLRNILELMIILAVAYYWSDKFFLRKISAIDHAARKLAEGDWEARTGILGTNELAHLAQTFDSMARTLQEKELRLESKEIQVEEANEELNRVNRSLRVLSAGNKSLLLARSELELLDRVCRDIVGEGGYLASWVGYFGPGEDRYLRIAASHAKADSNFLSLPGPELDRIGAAVREDRILVWYDGVAGENGPLSPCRSLIALPLHLEGRTFGVLVICAGHENEFRTVQIEYLKETAQDISFGIEMLRTREEKERLAHLGMEHEVMLRQSLEDALQAIALTIEMRDPYTSGHQHRVADLAQVLARELGMSEDEAHGLYLAAIVHDIGKIFVPSEILVKPGKLSDTEYLLVRQHVVAGYEILKGIKFSWPLADIVRQHHERIDGSGYPSGLKGGEILFGARILAVADVVEAMASHRPYRPGLGTENALQEIEKGRGVFYDEAVVDACLRLFREGRFAL